MKISDYYKCLIMVATIGIGETDWWDTIGKLSIQFDNWLHMKSKGEGILKNDIEFLILGEIMLVLIVT